MKKFVLLQPGGRPTILFKKDNLGTVKRVYKCFKIQTRWKSKMIKHNSSTDVRGRELLTFTLNVNW